MSFRSLLSLFAATALAVGATVGLSTAASANSYGVIRGDATVSATTVATGGTVTVAGDNFCPSTRVALTVSKNGKVYITKRLRADLEGDVFVRVKLTRAGTNSIKLSGQTSDCNGQIQVLGVKISVGSGAGGAEDNSSALPRTGGGLAPLWTGVGLLLAGGLLVGAARNRRHATA